MFKIKVCNNCKNNKCFESQYNTKWEPIQGYFIAFAPNNNICPYCNNSIEDTGIDYKEYEIISKISNDNAFLEAMIDLKQKDIIEYELKMSQFRNQVEQQKSIQNQQVQVKQESNVPKCPTCGSTKIKKISGTKKAASIIGFGILSNNIGKTYECLNCKYKW